MYLKSITCNCYHTSRHSDQKALNRFVLRRRRKYQGLNSVTQNAVQRKGENHTVAVVWALLKILKDGPNQQNHFTAAQNLRQK